MKIKINEHEIYEIEIPDELNAQHFLEVLERLREKDKSIVPIVITGYATIESAVESMKKGAFDFLPKPFTPA